MLENKAVRVLLSALIAFALWFYVITVVSTEYDQTFSNIPISFQGEAILEERGLMITTKDIPKVTLQLYGNRSDLSKLDSSNITISVDLSRIGEAGTHTLSTSNISYPGDIRSDAVSVLNRNPDTVTLTVEKKAKKEVPVNVVYEGAVPEDFIADKDNAILDHNMVTIEGPESVIEQITQARVDVALEDKNASFSENYRFTLCDKDGNPVDASLVETNVADVNLTLSIQRIKQIPLRIEVIDGGGATANTATIELSHGMIEVSGNDAVLEQLDELLLGTINLADIPQATKLTFPVTLPSSVTNISGVTEVTVGVRFPQLSSKTFTVTDITAINVPEGMEAEILTRAVQVTIRGPKELMKTVQASDISITVDLTDAQAGTSTVKGTVKMDSKYAQAGAIKSDSISVTLRSNLEAVDE